MTIDFVETFKSLGVNFKIIDDSVDLDVILTMMISHFMNELTKTLKNTSRVNLKFTESENIALKKRLIKHYLNYLNFKEQVTKMKNNDDWNPNGLIIKGYRKIYPPII